MTTRNATHPAEQFEAEQAARATHYTAFLHNGRGNRHNVRCETIAEARSEAARLTREVATQGRRAMVYAVTPEGMSIHLETAGRA